MIGYFSPISITEKRRFGDFIAVTYYSYFCIALNHILKMNLKLNPLSVLRVLLCTIFILLFANIFAIAFKLNSDSKVLIGATALFDFNQEANVPTLFSSLSLLASALLLFYIYWSNRLKDKSAKRWLGLSLIFFFLTVDEIGSIHERIMPLLRNSFELTGVFYYAWIIPYGIAIILLSIIYLPFVLKLPKNIKLLFLASAAIYISGAIGIEILGGQQDESYGTYNFVYAFYYTIEELLEMVGIALFIYALLIYIEGFSGFERLNVKIQSSASEEKIGRMRFYDTKK